MKKEIETINKGQEEMKNTISELKNTVEGIKSKLNEAEHYISKLEDKVEKNTQKEQEKEKSLRKNEEGLREMQDNMKHNNIHITEISEEEKQQGIENLFEKFNNRKFAFHSERKSDTSSGSTEGPNHDEPRGPIQDTS